MHSPLGDDYYALLGIHAGADGAELRRAWRQLALRWHPDRAGHAATATFQQLAAAYDVLADPVARAAYDRRRRAADLGRSARPAPATTSPPASPPPRPARPPAPGVLLGRVSGPINSLIACGAVRLDDDEPGFITLVLHAAEAAQGGMATISMRVELWCPDCAAKDGASQGRSATRCPRCGGTRTVEELFSAWLAVPPGVTTGEVLAPSVELPGMVEPVRFRVRFAGTAS
jgi:DnaJ-class molecular chaperone